MRQTDPFYPRERSEYATNGLSNSRIAVSAHGRTRSDDRQFRRDVAFQPAMGIVSSRSQTRPAPPRARRERRAARHVRLRPRVPVHATSRPSASTALFAGVHLAPGLADDLWTGAVPAASGPHGVDARRARGRRAARRRSCACRWSGPTAPPTAARRMRVAALAAEQGRGRAVRPRRRPARLLRRLRPRRPRDARRGRRRRGPRPRRDAAAAARPRPRRRARGRGPPPAGPRGRRACPCCSVGRTLFGGEHRIAEAAAAARRRGAAAPQLAR